MLHSQKTGQGEGMVFEPRYLNICSILKVTKKWKLLFETRINLFWALIVCWDSLIPFNILRQWSKSCYCYFIEEGNVDIERISCPKSQSQELPVFPGRRLRAQGSGCHTTQLPLWSPSGASVLLCSPGQLSTGSAFLFFAFGRGSFRNWSQFPTSLLQTKFPAWSMASSE